MAHTKNVPRNTRGSIPLWVESCPVYSSLLNSSPSLHLLDTEAHLPTCSNETRLLALTKKISLRQELRDKNLTERQATADGATRKTEANQTPHSQPAWAKKQAQGQPGQFSKTLSQNN